MCLLPLVTLGSDTSVSQEICGQYETIPGSTVQYMYLPGSPDFETLPVRATFNISCDDYSLSATVLTPIVGIDEDGNEIFPTGLTYPIVTTSDYDPNSNYTGSLQGTQYHYGWEFHDELGATARWSGFVSWTGGRYEETAIDNVIVTLIPEPTTSGFLWACFAIMHARMPHVRDRSPHKKERCRRRKTGTMCLGADTQLNSDVR